MSPNKVYAGIGSRKAPEDILEIMTKIAQYLFKMGYVLRSGGADGSDSYFESGAGDKKEIYLPWANFNNNKAVYVPLSDEALKLAEENHPYWHNLSRGGKVLHARNGYQILGADLKTPVHFIVCWTPGGKEVGGTAQALRIAKKYNIKVFNLGNEEDLLYWKNKLNG
jgi:hypothetical protein